MHAQRALLRQHGKQLETSRRFRPLLLLLTFCTIHTPINMFREAHAGRHSYFLDLLAGWPAPNNPRVSHHVDEYLLRIQQLIVTKSPTSQIVDRIACPENEERRNYVLRLAFTDPMTGGYPLVLFCSMFPFPFAGVVFRVLLPFTA